MEKPFCDYYELNKEKYQCLICGRCFLIVCDVQVLADHLQKNHLSQESDTNKPKYKEKYGGVVISNYHFCDECEFKSSYKSSLNHHKRSVHMGVKYPCNECSYKATGKSDLKVHKRSVHEGIKYPCDGCAY